MRVEKINAVVLHSRAWRETSQLLDIFTADYGRISVVSRGSRGGKPGRGSLGPFNLYQLGWTGRGELKTLTDRELQIQWHLAGERSLCGLYLNELLCRLLLNEDPHPHLFASYLTACDSLDSGVDEPATILRRFEIDLLTEMGYAIALDHDESGERFQPAQSYCYSPGQGWQIDKPETPGSLPGRTLLALARGELPTAGEESRKLRHQLRSLIDQLLDQRPLQSRELLLQYRLKKGKIQL